MQVNEDYLDRVDSCEQIDVDIYNILADEQCVETDVEMDEMWSFYHDKGHQIWLWWAVDHNTNVPLAYTFGTREHDNLDALLELLKPFNIGTAYTDGNYAYQERLIDINHLIGKRNTQGIERHHLTLRTRVKRLTRKSICFSKTEEMHKIVVGNFINTYFFNRKLDISTYL